MSATHPYTTEVPRPGDNGRSLAGLFSDLWRETTTLVHDEAELAKADVGEKVSLAVNGARSMAVGGAIVFAGFLVLLLAAVNAIGLIALASGRRHLQAENLKPQRTLDSLRRDRDVAKEHLR